MREFMTKVSDYFDEWRENPERRENQLSIVIIGAVAIVVIVLLLLLLWWGHGAQEKKKEEAAKKAAELEAEQALQAAQEARGDEEAQGLVTATYEEKMAEYMSTDSGEELRQEYLMNTNALAEKIKELQTIMEKAQAEIATVVKEYRNIDTEVTKKLTVLEKETGTVVEKINALEVKAADLSDAIRVIDGEKIPVIQGQIGELRGEIERTRTDISRVHEKIKALEKEDGKLWEKLSEVEKNFETVLGDNMKEIDKRVDHLEDGMNDLERECKAVLERMSEKVDSLSLDALGYRYEEETNTLYLMPSQGNE